jgi:hypothetical protein
MKKKKKKYGQGWLQPVTYLYVRHRYITTHIQISIQRDLE